jgi:signal recognition particle subunit SRP54
MTPEERRRPDVINGSRRTRIAKGSGVTTAEVNNLLKQFKQVQQMMRSAVGVRRKGKKGKGKRPRLPVGGVPGGGMPGGGMPGGGIPGLPPL